MFRNTDHTSILNWVGLTLSSHFLEQLGLSCHEVQEENIRTSFFFFFISSFFAFNACFKVILYEARAKKGAPGTFSSLDFTALSRCILIWKQGNRGLERVRDLLRAPRGVQGKDEQCHSSLGKCKQNPQ